LLEVLRRRRYAGWISLEAFDFSYGAEPPGEDSLGIWNAKAGIDI